MQLFMNGMDAHVLVEHPKQCLIFTDSPTIAMIIRLSSHQWRVFFYQVVNITSTC